MPQLFPIWRVRISTIRTVGTLVAVIAASVVLTGCAAQMAYRDGRNLIAEGKVEDGLARLHDAVEADPHSVEYRQTWLQARDRAIERFLDDANRFAAAGKASDAKALYERVLSIAPGNARARAGLAELDAGPRRTRWFNEAKAAADKKDTDLARTKLRQILAEDPNHAGALALRRSLDERADATAPEAGLAATYRKPITIEFKDVALKQVFEVISRTSGLNFLFDKDVKTDQKTSIFLKNSTVASAVHFVLLTNQLEQQVLDGNTILIYPNTAAKQKDYQEMVVKTFYLGHAEAKSVANTLKTILKMRDVVVDDKLNLLIVRDSPEAIRLAEKLVNVHDVAEPEVMLEVEILEIKRTRLLDLGIQWPDSVTLTPLASTIPATTSGTGTTVTGGTLTLRDLRSNLNGATIGAGISPVIVNANKTDTDANILANPRIRARNHEKAKILIGDRVPNITTTSTATGFVSESVNYVDVGLKLDVEPTVFLDGEVAIKIGLEVSSIVAQLQTKSGSVAYQIGTRNANTVLQLKDGENQVLAGLINDEERSTGNKIPGLGELPIVGRLFGATADNNQKTEIVLSITPHIVRNLQRPEAAVAEFASGTDSSFRLRPESAPVPASPAQAQAGTAAPMAGAAATNAPAQQAAQSTTSLPQGPAGSGNVNVNPTAPALNGPDNAALNSGGAINSAAAGASTALQWQGPSQVKVGDTFSVQVLMSSPEPLTAVPLTVGFDSKILQVVGITEGEFLKQGGSQTSFSSRVDANGQIVMTCSRTGPGGATQQGTLATLNFRAIGASPDSTVQVVSMHPVGSTGKPVAAPVPPAYSVQIQ
jgi:general secretion pathway protein D